ncbi:MAG: hypothetical protein NC308_02950 [Clostridium sp.]|nr:hypothetical protein [Bacteroides sp.]MCM1197822.1 hypothetical protein [Clostridium sp.]
MEANKKLATPTVDAINFDDIKNKLHIGYIDDLKKIDELSNSSLKLIQDKLSEYINNNSEKLSPEHLKTLQDAFHNANMKMAETDPGKGFVEAVKNYKSAAKEAEQAQKDLKTAMEEGVVVVEQYDDKSGKMTKSVLTVAEAEKRLIDAEKSKNTALSEASKSLKQTGKYGSESVDAAEGVVGMLGNFGVEVPEFVSGALSGLGQVMDGVGSIDLTNPVSMIKGISTALVGLGNFVASMVDAGDFVKEKEIKRIQKEVDSLSKSYQDLQEDISKAYSTDKASLIQESNDNLERQKELIQEQMALEDSKKKTDDEKIKNYKQELENIEKQIEENNKAWQEAATGVSFDSFRQSFLSVLLDMNSDAEDFANNFEKYLQNAIIDAMMTETYNDEIKKLYGEFAKYMKDDELSEEEVALLRKRQELLSQKMLTERDALAETFGWKNGTEEADARTASTAKGIAQASQESVDELNGRMTAMQGHTYSLMENTKILVDNSASMLERLCNIDFNTARLAYIEKDIHSMSAYLNQVAIQGIRVAV